MATDSPLSDQKLNANRKNAQRSTGPRTAAGKAASARNATSLGLFTRRDYVRPNERAEYRALGARYAAELRPEGVLEETLVTAIVSAVWRLRRCSVVEYGLAADNDLDPMQHDYDRDTQNSVDRARSHSSLLLRRSLLELRRAQTDRFLAQKLLAHEPDLPALASPTQIVTVINQQSRIQQSRARQTGATPRPMSMKDNDLASNPTPPVAPQSVASICKTDSVRPYPHEDPRKPKNPGQLAPPVLSAA